jgi:hypothetical protein
MMGIRHPHQVIGIIQQDPEPVVLQKEGTYADLPPELYPAIPLTLVLHKFDIGRTLLGKAAQGGRQQQYSKNNMASYLQINRFKNKKSGLPAQRALL